MGGGGVLRAVASRLVGVGAAVGGIRSVIRGSQSLPNPEYQTPFVANRRAPASTISASTGSVVVEKASSLDDWEYAGVGVDVVEADGSSSLPRVVFGGVPSFEEAKEAALELKTAVNETLMLENPGHHEAAADSLLLMGSDSVTYVSREVASAHALPIHAVRAFRFLSENPAAQNVVASIASDPNVWNAVLQNTVFVDYLESHRADGNSHDVDVHLNQHIGIEELQDLKNSYAESETSFVGSSESNESGITIAEIFQNIKLTVMDMVNHVSSFFQDVFGVPNGSEKTTADDASGTSSFTESTTLKASIMGLAIMVISMVVLKRV